MTQIQIMEIDVFLIADWLFRILVIFLLYWIGSLIENQTKYLKEYDDVDEIGNS